MKRSKSNDSQVLAADPSLDVKEYWYNSSNVPSIEEPEDDSLARGESEVYSN